MFHGIVKAASGWLRVITGADLLSTDTVVEEFKGGPYVAAFLDHFFPGRYRTEVRAVVPKKNKDGLVSQPAITSTEYSAEVIRWSTASDQYSVRIKGSSGWLSSFKEIGLNIRNSKKMSKRLVEITRMTSMWLYRPADKQLKVEVIKHSHPECYVDGISAISQELAIACIKSNRTASRQWRASQIQKIRTGETACVIFRALTPEGLIKGNALVLPKSMMNGVDNRTFTPNIKTENTTNGWQWVTIEPTYGVIPVKSDDLTHAIYRRVHGLYDDQTLMNSLEGMLTQFLVDLKNGKRSEWLNKLAENADTILHDEEAVDKYSNERGLIGRIQLAVGQLSQAGVPLSASQTLMFLSVNGLSMQLLNESLFKRNKNIGGVWKDKTRHWFPVPWAYSAHIYTKEVLELFGFDMPKGDYGFYHEPTHSFVVPGRFFQDNLANHGGPDLDDTVKIHVRNVVMENGQTQKMAFILRNPNDFGEWSMIPIRDNGPVFHAYGEIPTVSMDELELMVPQYSKLKSQLSIGSLPCMTNPPRLGSEFSLSDEQRVRNASASFPAGVGGTVLPKMIWYGVTNDILRDHVASNEDIIDAVQQGQASRVDVELIQQWTNDTFTKLGSKVDYTLDAFWYETRLPYPLKKLDWKSGRESESSWVELHRKREDMIRSSLAEMMNWLNSNIIMPEVLSNIRWTEEELKKAPGKLAWMRNLHTRVKAENGSWPDTLCRIFMESDEKYGEEATDRKILLLAYQSIVAKKHDGRNNYDQWLYAFDTKADVLPWEFYLRALKRLQP